MKNFFQQFTSIDEQKTSTLILGFIVMLVVGIWGYHKTLTFDPTIANIIIWLAGVIGGVNGLSGIASIVVPHAPPTQSESTTTKIETKG